MLDQPYIRTWILTRYSSCQFGRHLTQRDLQALEAKAGVQVNVTADPTLWATFREWFAKSLRALQQVGKHYSLHGYVPACPDALDVPKLLQSM